MELLWLRSKWDRSESKGGVAGGRLQRKVWLEKTSSRGWAIKASKEKGKAFHAEGSA